MATLPYLQTQWLELVAAYSSDREIGPALFRKLDKKYAESSRHYHTLEHIGAMLAKAHSLKEHFLDWDAVQFAIWFHDVIYSPTSSGNEEKSAQFAEKALVQLNVDQRRTNKVHDLILRTKNHTEVLASEDVDTQLLLDCDLLILGASREAYEQYVRQIRKEYWIFPDIAYKPGRLKVLKKFLGLPFIYRTTLFRLELEGQARENLAYEMELLMG